MKYTYAILGGTGHIGSALSQQLLKKGQSVLVIGHSEQKAQYWKDQGADFLAANVLDSETLQEAFASARRIFILNPPADPTGDAEAQELKQIDSILQALDGLTPQKIVMASTYGAREGKQIFDLGTLYQLEQGLKAQGAPLAIIRSAYYISNLDLPAEMALESGELTTVLPVDYKLPMVAPADIANLAAQLLHDDRTGTFYIQAEQEYAVADAARILGEILRKTITPKAIPEKDWASYMQEIGFSEQSTASFIGMTKLTINEKFPAPEPVIGQTTLEQHLTAVVEAAMKKTDES